MPRNLAPFARMLILVLGVLTLCNPVSAEAIALTGTVTDAGTGEPAGNVRVGATRTMRLRPGAPGAVIPVEATALTNSAGEFTFEVESPYPGLDSVVVFTQSPHHENQLHPGVPYTGRTPTHADAARAGVRRVDARGGGAGIDFALTRLETGPERHYLEMSDGTRLATDVYRPPGAGPWPTILYRTTYGIDSDYPGEQWLGHGYAVVAQDCRGTHGSEGLFRGFMDDGWGENKDGYETVVWILEQDWSNGEIGTFGGSARGITQNMLAGSAPPGLKGQWVNVAASDLYRQGLFHDGAFRKRLCEGWLAGRGSAALEYLLQEIVERPLYTDEYWGYMNVETRYPLVNWPMVHKGGWYDIFLRGTINNFVNIQHHGGPNARGNQRLIIDPYGHGMGEGGFHWPEGCRNPPARYNSPFAWLNHWIKGANTGVTAQPPVCYYVLGDVDDPNGPGNEWRFADDWPVPATEVAYYLHEGGLLSVSPPTAEESHQSYVYDPADPVPTLGGANLSGTRGPYDQRPVESRPDVLVFTTPVLEEYLEITGKVVVRLYASSSAVDTDFTAKLCDVYPDGRSMLVCDGIVRARHRNTVRSEEFLVPGEVYEFEIDLWETSIAFNVGHRVRVSISSSNYDRYDVNPNTGEPFRKHTHMEKATNTIYYDAARPSHILFRVTGPLPPGIPDSPRE